MSVSKVLATNGTLNAIVNGNSAAWSTTANLALMFVAGASNKEIADVTKTSAKKSLTEERALAKRLGSHDMANNVPVKVAPEDGENDAEYEARLYTAQVDYVIEFMAQTAAKRLAQEGKDRAGQLRDVTAALDNKPLDTVKTAVDKARDALAKAVQDEEDAKVKAEADAIALAEREQVKKTLTETVGNIVEMADIIATIATLDRDLVIELGKVMNARLIQLSEEVNNGKLTTHNPAQKAA